MISRILKSFDVELFSGFDGGPGKQTWHHVTISQLQESGGSDQETYKLSVRVDGKVIQSPITNDLPVNKTETIKAYISGPDFTRSLGYGKSLGYLNEHSVHNLRFIESRQNYVVKLGSKIFIQTYSSEDEGED